MGAFRCASVFSCVLKNCSLSNFLALGGVCMPPEVCSDVDVTLWCGIQASWANVLVAGTVFVFAYSSLHLMFNAEEAWWPLYRLVGPELSKSKLKVPRTWINGSVTCLDKRFHWGRELHRSTPVRLGELGRDLAQLWLLIWRHLFKIISNATFDLGHQTIFGRSCDHASSNSWILYCNFLGESASLAPAFQLITR